MIEKLTPCDDGGYLAHDGCWYESKSDYLATGVLSFWGCAEPLVMLGYIKAMFTKHVHQGRSEDFSCWDKTSYEDLPVMFFLCWANKEGYIEHGAGIRCSWMTEKGKELLKDLAEAEEDQIRTGK